MEPGLGRKLRHSWTKYVTWRQSQTDAPFADALNCDRSPIER
jgi:hypothetical protein